jgi:hypothetical protein
MTGRILWHLGDLVLEVRAGGRPAYRAPCRQSFTSANWMDLRGGAVVPVRVDRQDANVVLVDQKARDAAWNQSQQSDREAHKARQAALLAGAPVAPAGGGGSAIAAFGGGLEMVQGLGKDGLAAFGRMGENLQLLTYGKAGNATIVAVNEKERNGFFVLLALRLAVTPQDGAPFEADAEALFKLKRLEQLTVGASVPVKIDPSDSTHVVVDLHQH